MELTIGKRVGIALVGLVVVAFGLAQWTLTREYGHGLGFSMFGEGDTVVVYEHLEPGDGGEGQPGTPVFEGSQAEAEAYVDQRRAEATSYLIPGLILGTGTALILVAFLPRRRSAV